MTGSAVQTSVLGTANLTRRKRRLDATAKLSSSLLLDP